MNTLQKIAAAVGIVAVLIGGWFVLQGTGSGRDESGSITIGFIGPLTGDAASIGTVARSAAELAVEEINAAGGVSGRPLHVVYENGQCAASPASSAANKLMNADNVPIIVGGLCSTETATFAPQAMQNRTIVLSYCSSAPNLSQTGKYFFRNYPSDSYEGKVAAEYAYNTLDARKIAIIYHQTDWGTGIKDVFALRFRELGGEIVVEEGVPQTARDYRTILGKVKAANPDYLYAPTYPEGGTVLVQQAKQLGLTTKFLGTNAWSDPKLQKDASGLADILYLQQQSDHPEEFKAKLLAKTGGDEIPICASNAYDAMYILKAAIERADGISDPDALADAFRVTNYSGISGHIQFDENGDQKEARVEVRRIENGSSTLVQ